MSLSDKALLVSLNISQWAARKLDKRETQELAAKHGTVEGVARVNKALLPGAVALDKVHKKTGEIRTFFYEQTLPWGMEGSRILPSANYMQFVSTLRGKLSEWDQLYTQFKQDYPALQAQARVDLNGLYRDEDYPDVSEMDRKFKADVSFFPVPDAGDFRVTISNDELARLQQDVTERVEEAMGVAMRDCWERLHKIVKHAHEKLADPKAIFRDSLVENAKDLCSLLPRLNITNDAQLEAMRQDLEGALCSHAPEVLRLSAATRAETASKMADIMAKMGSFYQAAA